jgi:hypothetical protein
MGEKISCHSFFCSRKFHKIVNYFILDMLKKKIWPSFQRIIELFTQKFVTKLSKIWVWDPGSGINLFQIPDPGPVVKKSPDPESGSATLTSILLIIYISSKTYHKIAEVGSAIFLGGALSLECYLFFYVR